MTTLTNMRNGFEFTTEFFDAGTGTIDTLQKQPFIGFRMQGRGRTVKGEVALTHAIDMGGDLRGFHRWLIDHVWFSGLLGR